MGNKSAKDNKYSYEDNFMGYSAPQPPKSIENTYDFPAASAPAAPPAYADPEQPPIYEPEGGAVIAPFADHIHDKLSGQNLFAFSAIVSHDPARYNCARMQKLRADINISTEKRLKYSDFALICQRMQELYETVFPNEYRLVTYEAKVDDQQPAFPGGTSKPSRVFLNFFDKTDSTDTDIIDTIALSLLPKLAPDLTPKTHCYPITVFGSIKPGHWSYNLAKNRLCKVSTCIETPVLMNIHHMQTMLLNKLSADHGSYGYSVTDGNSKNQITDVQLLLKTSSSNPDDLVKAVAKELYKAIYEQEDYMRNCR